MSTLVSSLKKQNELLAAEVELYAGGLDRLAGELADALTRLAAYEKSDAVDSSHLVPVGEPITTGKNESKYLDTAMPQPLGRIASAVVTADRTAPGVIQEHEREHVNKLVKESFKNPTRTIPVDEGVE